jgi:hypothetical protein
MKACLIKHELINYVLKSNPEKMKAHLTKSYLPDSAVRIKLQILNYITN